MTNDDIYKLINFIGALEKRQVRLHVDDFNLLLKKASRTKFNKELGVPDNYWGAQPNSRTIYEVNQRITDVMRRFKVVVPTGTVVSGEYTLPAGYFYPTAISYTTRPIEVLNDAQWGWRLNDSNKTPTVKYPVARFLSDKIDIRPTAVTSIEFVYLKLPVEPVATYTVANGVMSYHAGSSTELDWDEISKDDIIAIMLEDIGIHADPGSVSQYAQLKKQQG